MTTLSASNLDKFRNTGFIHVPQVLDVHLVERIREEIWEELETEFGILQTDRSTWRTPPRSPKKAKYSQTNNRLINDRFRTLIDQLIGQDNWSEPSAWGGFLVNFPDPEQTAWNLANKLWHWDYELFRFPELGGLLIFSFFSEVEPKGGGTLVVAGSHRAIRNYMAGMTPQQKQWKHGEQRKHFMKTHPYFIKLNDPDIKEIPHIEWFMDNEFAIDGIPLQVVELTGKPGDVVFCHPRLIHAPAGVNLNTSPRIMRTKFLW